MCPILACDQNVLKDLMWLINFGECDLAVQIWTNFRKDIMKGCEDCPCINNQSDSICGKCLELTLRRYESMTSENAELVEECTLATRNLVDHYSRGLLL